MVDIDKAQEYMLKHKIDGWLIYDFRGSNPIFWQIIGENKHTSRRNFIYIPAIGSPKLLIHNLDSLLFNSLQYNMIKYSSWKEMHTILSEMLKECKVIAIEISPMASIPTVSYVDYGTYELIKSFTVDLVSSADIFQFSGAAWSEASFNSHVSAAKCTNLIMQNAFDFIALNLNNNKKVSEYDVQQFIINQYIENSMETDDNPIVAVNANSGNPHYEPDINNNKAISRGDWVLIDLWAKHLGIRDVFADITWVGYVGSQIPEKYVHIFDIVKLARDKVVNRLYLAWKENELLEGWQLDDIARNIISESGYGDFFIHRTGHNIAPGAILHAFGVNLDNYETHDSRRILPGIGFSIEPGIYLPEFGVRLEINVYVHPVNGPIVTTPLQDNIVKII